MRSLFIFKLLFCSVLFAEQPPNFLLFMADDMTYTDLGCYGNPDVKTPNLDAFAKEGMKFNYSFNSSPMCAPTRMSLYSGIHPVRNGAHPNHSSVYEHIKTLPFYLKEMGYEVAILGKRHERPLENFPFTRLSGRHHDNGKGLDLDLSEGAEFIERHKEQPWCLVVTSNQPHTPWNRGDPSVYQPEKLKLPPYFVDTVETRVGLSQYYAEITYMDDQFGQVMHALKQSGEEQETFVIFLTEQGSNFPHCKWTCYDSGLRSAQIIRWPGVVERNTESDAMVQYVDVLPTFIEAAGEDPKSLDFDGKSFMEILKGTSNSHHNYTFGVQTSKGIYHGPEAYGIRTIRSDRYRLIWNLNYKNSFKNSVVAKQNIYRSWLTNDHHDKTQYHRYQTRPEFELYDLKKDPYEMTNLVNQPELQHVKKNLKQKLDAWMKQQGDLGKATEASAKDRIKDTLK